MRNIVLVELKNDNALNLLYDLEKMNILEIVKEKIPSKLKLSEKLKGLLTNEQADDLKEHVKSIRGEWKDTL